MAVLDGAIANVALPVIAHQLGASPAASVWIINAYQLTITMLLLPLAALGDRVGYKCIYIPGLALFTIGSVACAARRDAPAADRRPSAPGDRRRLHHEHERGARSSDLSGEDAGARDRIQCDGPVDLGGNWPDSCRADPQRRIVAVAVPDQPADRNCRADRWPASRCPSRKDTGSPSTGRPPFSAPR